MPIFASFAVPSGQAGLVAFFGRQWCTPHDSLASHIVTDNAAADDEDDKYCEQHCIVGSARSSTAPALPSTCCIKRRHPASGRVPSSWTLFILLLATVLLRPACAPWPRRLLGVLPPDLQNSTSNNNSDASPAPPRRSQSDDIVCPMQGILQSALRIDKLPVGWTVFYDAPYSHPTSVSEVRPRQGECLLWGAAKSSESGVSPTIFSVAAFGNREKIETEVPVWENEAYWYLSLGVAVGFAPSVDIDLSPGDDGPYDCQQRLSWLLNGAGGYRAGCDKDLEDSTLWRKMVLYGPAGVFCDESICPARYYLKVDPPDYCELEECTVEECCSLLPSCPDDSTDLCSLQYIVKENPPAYCSTQFCQADECCQLRATCNAAICPEGYYLKPTGTLPPVGQPANGCRDYECTVSECCSESERCTEDVCATGFALSTTDPAPYCNASECLATVCCSPAGECSEVTCPDGWEDLLEQPDYCSRPDCNYTECCELRLPTTNVSSAYFVDWDLNEGTIGGVISWVPPVPGSTTVTGFSVYTTGNDEHPAALVGLAAWGTNEVYVPIGTTFAGNLVVYTSNYAGNSIEPIEANTTDIFVVPSSIDFVDLDLDPQEVGGEVSWSLSYDGLPPGLETLCRRSLTLAARSSVSPAAATTSSTSAQVWLGGTGLLTATASDGIIVMAFDGDFKVDRQLAFETGTSSYEASRLSLLLSGFSRGTPFALLSMGDPTQYLEKDSLAASLGSTLILDFKPDDTYAFLGAAGEGPWREMLVASGHGWASYVDLSCPISSFQVDLTTPDSDWSTSQKVSVGTVDGSTRRVSFPANLAIVGEWQTSVSSDHSYMQVLVNSPGGTFKSEHFPVEDQYVLFNKLGFSETDPTDTSEVGGRLSWTLDATHNAQATSVEVYLGWDAQGGNRTDSIASVAVLSGGSMPSYVDIESGTPRYNATYMIITAVSVLEEQTTPRAVLLSEIQGQVEPIVVAVIVGTVGFLHMARIMEALEKLAKKLDTKAIDHVPMRGSFVDQSGAQLQIREEGFFGFLPWRAPASQLCHCVPHHAKHLKVIFRKTGSSRHQKLPCFWNTKHRTIKNVQMTDKCENAWDNDELVLKKLSNKSIMLFRQGFEPTVMHRKPAYWWTFVEGSTVCSRTALRMYAPLMALLAVSFLIAYAGEVIIAVAMLSTCLAFVAFAIAVIPLSCTKQFIQAIKELPPKRIRAKFWRQVSTVVGCLPCAPAFLAGTSVGYMAGSLALFGAFLTSRKAYGAAVAVEGFGGVAITAYSIYLQVVDSSEGVARAARMTASTMAGILVCMKAVDTQIENMQRLHCTNPLPVDEVIDSAETTEKQIPMGLPAAVTLEAFRAGAAADTRSQRRLVWSLHTSSLGLLTETKITLLQYLQDFHDPLGRNWPKGPTPLAVGVSQIIEATSESLKFGELVATQGLKARNEIFDHMVERFTAMEESIRGVLRGVLGSRHVASYKKTVERFREQLQTLQRKLQLLEEHVGQVRCVEGRSGCKNWIELFGAHVALVTDSILYIQDEIAASELSRPDLRILYQKVRQTQKLVARLEELIQDLPTSPTEEPLKSLPEYVMCLGDELEKIINAFNSITSTSKMETGFGEVLQSLQVMREQAETLGECHQALVELIQEPPGEPLEEALLDAYSEMQARIEEFEATKSDREPDMTEDQLEHIAMTLATARNSAGEVSAVFSQLEVCCRTAEEIATAMSEARRVGYKMLHQIEETRDKVHIMTIRQISKVQSTLIEYALGAPLTALVNLQDLSSNLMRSTLGAMQRVVLACETAHVEASKYDQITQVWIPAWISSERANSKEQASPTVSISSPKWERTTSKESPTARVPPSPAAAISSPTNRGRTGSKDSAAGRTSSNDQPSLNLGLRERVNTPQHHQQRRFSHQLVAPPPALQLLEPPLTPTAAASSRICCCFRSRSANAPRRVAPQPQLSPLSAPPVPMPPRVPPSPKHPPSPKPLPPRSPPPQQPLQESMPPEPPSPLLLSPLNGTGMVVTTSDFSQPGAVSGPGSMMAADAADKTLPRFLPMPPSPMSAAGGPTQSEEWCLTTMQSTVENQCQLREVAAVVMSGKEASPRELDLTKQSDLLPPRPSEDAQPKLNEEPEPDLVHTDRLLLSWGQGSFRQVLEKEGGPARVRRLSDSFNSRASLASPAFSAQDELTIPFVPGSGNSEASSSSPSPSTSPRATAAPSGSRPILEAAASLSSPPADDINEGNDANEESVKEVVKEASQKNSERSGLGDSDNHSPRELR